MSLELFFNQSQSLNETISTLLAIEISANHVIISAKKNNGELCGLKHVFLTNSAFGIKGIDEILDVLKNNPALQHAYKKTIISINTPYSIVVPESIFEENKSITLLQSQFKIGNDVKLIKEKLDLQGAYLISAIPELLYNKLTLLFPTAQIISGGWVLFSINENPEEYDVNVFTDQEKIIMSAFNNGKLILYNSYFISRDDDFLYYIINALDKINFNLSNTKINLYGLIYESDYKYQTLKNYIGTVNLVNYPNPEINNSQVFFTNIQSHLCA